MLLNDRTIENLSPLDRRVQIRDFTVYWRGFAYEDGLPAGAPSIEKFAAEATTDLPAASVHLKGNYFVAAVDNRTGDRYAFVDQSALFQAFYSSRLISTSFLDLIAEEQLHCGDMNPEAVVEFFHFGNIYAGRTFFNTVRKLPADEILCLTPGRSIATIAKPVPDLTEPPSRSLLDCFRSFATAATGEKISLDLTGGIDSRLLAVVLQYFGAPFEAVTSGNEDNLDVAIAREVASLLQVEYHWFRHDATQMESRLAELFYATDGLCDLVRSYRAYEVQKDRLARDVTLMVSGAGGELYKDFWWLQDFPFYTRRTPQLERLFDLRLCAVPLNHTLLNGVYRELSQAQRFRTLQELAAFTVEGNTQTYDRVYYGFKMREYAGRFLSNYRDLLTSYAPYLESEAVRFGYNLPRRQRFFNFFHRQTMTRLNPAAARVPTTEGKMTVSSEFSNVFRDLSKYVTNRMSRLACKVRQRFGQCPVPAGSPDDPRLRAIVRDLPHTKDGLGRLKESGILVRSAKIDDLSSTQIGTVLTLGLLFDFLERNSARKKSVSAASFASATSS